MCDVSVRVVVRHIIVDMHECRWVHYISAVLNWRDDCLIRIMRLISRSMDYRCWLNSSMMRRMLQYSRRLMNRWMLTWLIHKCRLVRN